MEAMHGRLLRGAVLVLASSLGLLVPPGCSSVPSAQPTPDAAAPDAGPGGDTAGDIAPSDPGLDGAPVDAVDGPPLPPVPLDPQSPWPKFRQNPQQDGRAAVSPVDNGARPFVFTTGKGVFSSPVVDGDGNLYVGSADRVFYSVGPDGQQRWQVRTGEIIDSSALLDDLGRVYFGSGDGLLRALDRSNGHEVWHFQAADPSVNHAFINWFEGNVAMLVDGTLLAPNDNFSTYAVDRMTGQVLWHHDMSDQTWSLPALDVATGTLYGGNNFYFANNVLAYSSDGGTNVWMRSVNGTVAASPLLYGHGDQAVMMVGGFDGFLRAYRTNDGHPMWSFGARDHIYASPALLSDGTVVQPAADGTVYGLDATSGQLRWAFDTLEPLRSSPAVDAADNIYLGSGEGKLFVLNPDGTLRWSLQLISEERNDLNASVALGPRGIYLAGETGEVFYVPFDYCLRPGLNDARCHTGGEALPPDGALLLYTTRFGGPLLTVPDAIDANQPLTCSLFVRKGGDTVLAAIDGSNLQVDVQPPPQSPVRVDLSADRHFLVLTPTAPFQAGADGKVTITFSGQYLVNLQRTGLRFSGGTAGGALQQSFALTVRAAPGGVLAVPIAQNPGEDTGIIEVSRLAAPLPTILPSYNQIGFDSITYLLGIVEGTADHAVVWGIGAAPSGPQGQTQVDPASGLRFPLVMSWKDGLLDLINDQHFEVEFNGFNLPFDSFRISTRTDTTLNALQSPALIARAKCGDIQFYGAALQALGLCNPDTDILLASGAAELKAHQGGTQSAPAGLGTVTLQRMAASGGQPAAVVASFSGSSLMASQHNFGILLVDATTGTPLNLGYIAGTQATPASDGTIASVSLAVDTLAGPVRAYAMVDAYPAARAELPAD
jgi:outer membrane protein assembly factor BamB